MLFPERRFVEVHVECSLEECRRRDPKGLYALADCGGVKSLTGVTSPYEAPENPEMVVRTDRSSQEEIVREVLTHLTMDGIIPSTKSTFS